MSARLKSTISKVGFPLLTLILIIGIWQLICSVGNVPKYMLPAPSDVWNSLVNDWELIFSHTKVTLTETFIGLIIGIILGFLMAVLMDRFTIARRMIYPIVVVSQTIPTIAIAPLLVLWMGYKMLPKIVLIVLVVFFPIAISLLQSFSSADPDTVNLLRSMGAGRVKIFRYVKLPGSLGHFFSSLKISVSYAVVSAVVSEWIGGSEGLGVYMTRVRKSNSPDKLFAVIILISVISLLLILLTSLLQKACMPWERINKEKRK